jgi:hypothetical protein
MADKTQAAISYMKRFHEERVRKAVGYEALIALGEELDPDEIISISMYGSNNRQEKEYIVDVLKNHGRPVSLEDPTFTRKCSLCSKLVNYCYC